MGEQTCKDCLGTGIIVTRGRFIDGEDWCVTCDATGTIHRTGPYKLSDGTWSDGVDRTDLLASEDFGNKNPDLLTVVRPSFIDETWIARGEVWVVVRGINSVKWYPTHAEAIAYADRMARTNQGETK